MKGKTCISRIQGPVSALSNYEKRLRKESHDLVVSVERRRKRWFRFFRLNE